MKDMYSNGLVIKSYTEASPQKTHSNYRGIGRFVSWPLDFLQDSDSILLSKELEERWFGYQDDRLHVVPDLEFLQEYLLHCQKMGITTFCLQIESTNPILTFSEKLPVVKTLGYEYADVDMATSCFHDDLSTTIDYVQKAFHPIKQALNEFELVDSIETLLEYIRIRERLIKNGFDMEEYFSPTIIKLSEVRFPAKINGMI